MAQQDVSTMRSAYEAFNRGDIPAVLNAFDPQIEWHEPGGGRSPRGTYHGAQNVAKDVFSTVPENFDAFQAEQDQVIDAHEHVVVIGRFRGKAKSGAALDVPYVHVWAMRNGKAVSFHNYVEIVRESARATGRNIQPDTLKRGTNRLFQLPQPHRVPLTI